ncbi:MAG TPA: hypothetical protein VIQ74_04720 [Gemmatimonadaceae bacterium]
MEDVLQFAAVMLTIAIVMVGSYVAVKATNRKWGRSSDAPSPRELSALRQQLEQLQHSVDSVAVEVERISEGQRFTTKLLAERKEVDGLPAAAGLKARA